VDYTIEKTVSHVKRLREMRFNQFYFSFSILNFLIFSPLWEMVQEGVDLKSIKWSQH